MLGRMEWEEQAEARVKKAPFFIRPFIRSRAEKVARARGLDRVTVALLDELKSKEHRG
jgi:anaerobic sulfite reductase subunit C